MVFDMATDKAELLSLLSSCDPRQFGELPGKASSTLISQALRFYQPVPKDRLFQIWQKQRTVAADQSGLTAEEWVEDAGLEAETVVAPAGSQTADRKKARAVKRR
jgi:hypothetical protein